MTDDPQTGVMSGWMPAFSVFGVGLAVAGFGMLSSTPMHAAAQVAPKARVLLFVATDCPISNVYAPELKRIMAQYGPEHVTFSLVYADPTTTTAAAKKHMRDFGYKCPFVIDRGLVLAHKSGATITPEAVVYGSNGTEVYRGRIDNRYASLGVQRDQATVHDLRATLEAAVTGKHQSLHTAPAIGCYIPGI